MVKSFHTKASKIKFSFTASKSAKKSKSNISANDFMVYSNKVSIDETFAIKSSNDIAKFIENSNLYDKGIKHFAYVKLFADGTRIHLASTQNWTKCFFNNYFNIGMTSKPFNTYENSYLLCAYQDKSHVYSIMRNEFNIEHGFLLIDKYSSFCEIAMFASTREYSTINNYYINNLDKLRNCLLDFKDTHRHLIEKSHKDRLILPKNSNRIIFELSNNSNDSQRFSLDHQNNNHLYVRLFQKELNKEILFSKQQSRCFKLLIKGYSIKEIANLMQLSPRTVEHYIEKIREILICKNIKEIILKYSQTVIG